jgi:hypothetical protein
MPTARIGSVVMEAPMGSAAKGGFWHRIWPELIGAEGAPDVPEPTTQEAA